MEKDESTQAGEPDNEQATQAKPAARRRRLPRWGRLVLAALLVIVLVGGGAVTYAWTSTSAYIRQPQMEHYHFRLQVLVNGKALNFAEPAYQLGYAKDQCSGLIADQPFHFHDKKDQFVHVHWEGMTGGELLKYYGWNVIGGPDNTLGYRFNSPTNIDRIPIHGKTLPALSKDANLYVYSGDAQDYHLRKLADWRDQDLEKFLGTTSNFPAHQTNRHYSSLSSKLLPHALAHGADNDLEPAENETELERLTRLNNLLGNVVIFAQSQPPSNQQVKDRFNQLLPLDDSTCGG